MIEALHNWTAIRFLVAPWDWNGILMARVIHEAGFFNMGCESESQERTILDKFIDVVNRTNISELTDCCPTDRT